MQGGKIGKVLDVVGDTFDVVNVILADGPTHVKCFDPSQLIGIFADTFGKGPQNGPSLRGAHFAPGFEGVLGRAHGSINFSLFALGHRADDLVGGRV